MEFNKVKTTLIIVLLAVNLFLAAMLRIDYQRENVISGNLEKTAYSLLKSRGVEIVPGAGGTAKHRLNIYTAALTRENGKAFAEDILGLPSGTEEIADGTKYLCAGGYLSVFGTNSIEAALEEKYSKVSERKIAKSLAEAAGLQKEDVVFFKNTDFGNTGTVEFFFYFGGIRVDGYKVTATYKNGYLTGVSGNFPSFSNLSKETQYSADVLTALFNLADYIDGNVLINHSEVVYIAKFSEWETIEYVPAYKFKTADSAFLVYFNGGVEKIF